jgi:very-short-patch-repair endonuclease
MEKQNPFINGKGKGSLGHLRKGITEGEGLGWPRRPGKPIRGVPFYRQRPMGHCMVDFSAPKANLVVKEDGSQPQQTKVEKKGKSRDRYSRAKGIEGQRLNANEVVREIDTVNKRIYEIVNKTKR